MDVCAHILIFEEESAVKCWILRKSLLQ